MKYKEMDNRRMDEANMTQYNFYYRGDKELSKVLHQQDLGQLLH